MRVFPWAGTYVMVQDVVEGWLQVMEANAPEEDDVRGLTVVLNVQGFYQWTFPNAKFSVYLPAWLGRILSALLLLFGHAPSCGGDHRMQCQQ